jgi:UDP-N-acetylmuramate dehydrogenase
MLLRKKLCDLEIDFEENVLVGKLTAMNQNSILPIVVKPNSVLKLKELIKYCIKQRILFDILGGLTNTYLCESYYKDIVIITTRVCDIERYAGSVSCGCGVNLTKFSKECVYNGIAGYEGFIGIPGTIGAAAINNSGAFNSSMSKVIKDITIITTNGDIICLNNYQLKYDCRSSILKREKIGYVLTVTLDTSQSEDIVLLQEKLKELAEYRRKNIDGHRKSLGSVFVASSLCELYKRHTFAMFVKKLFYSPFKLIIKNKKIKNKINTYLTFMFLGIPSIAKYCDSLNRFCWDKKTNERNFFHFIESMQNLSANKLQIEIDIKK